MRRLSHPMRTVTDVPDKPIEVDVRGWRLRTTAAFASYWHLAAERQRIFFSRLRDQPPPWTDDPVLSTYRFTNAYRASDRVSQFLINDVIYGTSTDPPSTVLRVLLFKIFNRVDTWRVIEDALGGVTVETFDAERLAAALSRRREGGAPLYSPAYIMPSPPLGNPRKHVNHVQLLARLLADGTIEALLGANSLRRLYHVLAQVPSFGPFLAFQFAVDLNYSELFSFSEMEFVVAGPGARAGIEKCFVDPRGVSYDDIIRAVAEASEQYAAAAGVQVESLWGRPLQLVDCQNLFCEVDKYSRVRHPELASRQGRRQIKQRFVPSPEPLTVGYPPKWGLKCDVFQGQQGVCQVGPLAHRRSPLVSVSASL